MSKMSKSYFITGANKGIGFELVKRILKDVEDSFVFLGARSLKNGEAAIASLSTEFAQRVKLVIVDVTKPDSVEAALVDVQAFLAKNEQIGMFEALVNNAGVFGKQFPFKEVLDVNVRGVHNITSTFISLIKPTGRIVNLSSIRGIEFVTGCNEKWREFMTSGDTTWEEIDELMNTVLTQYLDKNVENSKLLDMGQDQALIDQPEVVSYSMAKALTNTLTIMQAKKYPNMKINSCMPGYIFTDMTRHFVDNDTSKMASAGMKSLDESTVAPFFLACDPSLNTTGLYYLEDATVGAFF